ncbi:MAG: NAD(P)/FAD-dependent oxidoreductase [Rhodospirillaceae bacterium]|nr:NAD(P)/FAD-dependent oxidoreductase [Rhodospirillaceae bacterium]MBT6119054.1 NAD(P)/FAD-dependent oxidoreductase [Rhodospirillaceae bacterium]
MTERFETDCAVVGAGVVGLAVARALALAGREVLILEAAEAIGTGVTSRSSEVIHAGIYYPTGSRKARACVAGKRMLYDYCEARGVPHRRSGKLIVACDRDEAERLPGIRAKAEENGVDDLSAMTAAQARDLEPALACADALLSPSTGVVDGHALMLALLGDAESAGAMLATHAPVGGGEALPDGRLALCVGGEAPMRLDCRTVVNCAALGAPDLARAIDGIDAAALPRIHWTKGNYFTCAGRPAFTRLIYPVPGAHGWLGLHLTIDMGGQLRFGPDMTFVDAPDYEVDTSRLPEFYAAIRRYWPALPDGALQPGYVGVRPKIHGPDDPVPDFVIQGPEGHGVPGLINLFGIESPGLTSCLALAEEVADLSVAMG